MRRLLPLLLAGCMAADAGGLDGVSGPGAGIPATPFGRVPTSEIDWIVQGDGVYTVNGRTTNTSITASGTVAQADGLISANSGAATSSGAEFSSRRVMRYRTGQGALALFTAVAPTCVEGNESLVGIGGDENGLFFGCNGSSWGVLRRTDSSDNWTAQASWNGAVPAGYDPTKGNIYRIRFQWLGFGQIEFGMEDAATGMFSTVHAIRYANTSTAVHIRQPSMPFALRSTNSTNATNVTIKTASYALGLEGPNELLGPTLSLENGKAVNSTLTNILTLRAKTSYGGINSQVPLNITDISFGYDGTKTGSVHLYRGATLGGSPSYTDVGADSAADYDVAGTTSTNGDLLYSRSLTKTDGGEHSFERLILYPGETMTLAAHTSSGTADVEMSVTWVEEQ